MNRDFEIKNLKPGDHLVLETPRSRYSRSEYPHRKEIVTVRKITKHQSPRIIIEGANRREGHEFDSRGYAIGNGSGWLRLPGKEESAEAFDSEEAAVQAQMKAASDEK